MTADPDVVLKIGEHLYQARLSRVEDPFAIADALTAFASKYRLAGSIPSSIWLWRVDPRA